ncbi:MAG: DUF4115 domain-containing protein [Thermoanaerobaculia bacterium]
MANQRGKNKPRPWQANGEEEVSFGTWLRRQREVREIGLREIADASKISLRYLEAFEQDRFDVLPAVVFARGFLREYAKYVGLDADEAVNRFLAAYRDSESGEEVEPQRPERAGSNQWLYNLLMFVAVAAVLVLIAVVAFKAERRRKETGEPVAAAALPPAPAAGVERLPAAAAPSPAVPPPAEAAAAQVAPSSEKPPAAAAESPPAEPPPGAQSAPPPASTAPLVVTLDFADSCWVEARLDGKRSQQQQYSRGESLRLEAQDSVDLTLGNAPGVQIFVNGKRYAPELGSSKVLRGLKIDLATAKAIAGGP